jgi:hypothetical protein
MQERQPGCICELNSETGEPIVSNYAECPVHKPDAITPKDTAKRLVFQYKQYADWNNDYGSAEEKTNTEKAKKCAIVCVDEILNVLDTFQTHEYAKVLIPYYNSVKEEINKL